MPNEYKPRFHNPVPLPPVDDFRLSTILLKYVPEESEAVKKALIDVAERHQNDLKLEIRRLLTVEQKIQYLNIDVAKKAQALRRKITSRRKRHEKALQVFNNELEGSLHSEINLIISVAQQTSAQVQGLAHRALEYDRLRNGPLSGPNPRKYPRLASFFGTGVESVDVDVTESEMVDGYMDSQADKKQYEIDTVDSHDDSGISDFARHELNGFQSAFLEDGSFNLADPKNLSPKDNDLAASSSEEELPHESPPELRKNSSFREPSPEEITPEDFEQIMDLSISKYRLQRQRKYEELDLFGPSLSSRQPSTTKSKSNPLRLLYSSQALANSDMLKSSTVEDSSLKSPFVTSKSVATVLPTPQTSLYKKLRINAQPLKYNKQANACPCQEADEGVEDRAADTSPAKEALSRTLNNFLASAGEGNSENYDNHENPFGIDSDSDDHLTDSSDEEVSGYLSIDEVTQEVTGALLPFDTPESRRRALEGYMNLREFSPTPKHQPSHRTLKPKGLILKISNDTRRGVFAPSPRQKLAKTTFALADGLPQKNNTYSEIIVETPYRASPRASFVNESSALGMILGTEGVAVEDSGDEVHEGEVEENGSINGSTKSNLRDSGDYKSIGVLRSLLV